MKSIFLIPFSFLALGSTALASDDRTDSTFSTKEINLYQVYTPEVTLPKKQKLKPSEVQLSHEDNTTFEYNVPAQALNYAYGAISIKPLALQPLARPISYQNYGAIGFGNLSTIYADLGLTYHQEGQYDAYIHGSHLSQRGGSVENRQSSRTSLRAGGKYFLPQHIITGNVGLDRRGITRYGYNPVTYTPASKDDIRDVYTTLELNAGLEKFNLDPRGIAIQPELGFYLTSAHTGGTESGFKFNAPFSYQIEEGLDAGIGVAGLLTAYEGRNNSYFQINPYIQYQAKKLYAYAGFSPTTASRNGWSILPQLKLRYVLGSRAALSAGWTGDIAMYNLRQQTEKNPFVYAPLTDNAWHKKLYGGIELALISNVKVEAKAIYHRFSQYAYFDNDYSDLSGHRFQTKYLDDIGLFEFYAATNILLSNKFDLGARFSFYTFNKVIPHEPRIDMTAYMRVRPISWLALGANLQALSGIKYFDVNGLRENIKPALNLSLSGQADVTKRIGVFLNLDNILNHKYQRWNQYEVYGFNIFGGIKVKF